MAKAPRETHRSIHISGGRGRSRSRGAATLDYVLILAVVLPMLALIMRIAPRLMNLVYEMTSVLVSWPFL